VSTVRAIVELECDGCRSTVPVGPYRYRSEVVYPEGWTRRRQPVNMRRAAWDRGPMVDLCPRCDARWMARLRQYQQALRRDTKHEHHLADRGTGDRATSDAAR
jgi:hypothetical protein